MILEAPTFSPSSKSLANVPCFTENHLLTALSPADQEAIQPFVRRVTLEHGHVLFEPGQEITNLHFPCSGAVSLVTVLRDGSSVEACMVGREGASDATSYVAARQASARCVVQLPGEAMRIEAARLRELAQNRPGLRAIMERYAVGLLVELQQSVACNAVHRLEQRLAKWLLRSQDRSEGDVLQLTQEFLSEMLGAQRTTVTQIASVLQKTGAIEYRRGKIAILDRALLARLSCECYAATQPATQRVLLDA